MDSKAELYKCEPIKYRSFNSLSIEVAKEIILVITPLYFKIG